MTTDQQRIEEVATQSSPDLDGLEEILDESDHQTRLAAIRTLSKDDQARLYEAAEDRPAGLECFVPNAAEPMREVIHDGKNSLPAFSSFQKRFCRAPTDEQDEQQKLWGYNEQTFRALTGPGYFTAYESDETNETWIDYRKLPDDHPADWPDIISNESRLGRFVYAGTVDRMRRLSEHVTVGRAYRAHRDTHEPMDNWFVLVRTPGSS